MNLVLCGFMGCGKTTCGRRLAARLGMRFLDMDEFIEERAGCTVREIFDREGEEGFRARERAACAELARGDGAVIAAGGGALCDARNVRTLRPSSHIVFLDVPLDVLRARLRGDTTRPLLQSENVQALFERRMPLYRAAADAVVPASGAPDEVADAVCAWLQKAEDAKKS